VGFPRRSDPVDRAYCWAIRTRVEELVEEAQLAAEAEDEDEDDDEDEA
jgi:hypothetical protein